MDIKVPKVPPPWTITLPTFWTSSPPLIPILSAPKPPNMAPATVTSRCKKKMRQFYSHRNTCPPSCPSWSPSSFCQSTRADPLRSFPPAQASLSENVDTKHFSRFSFQHSVNVWSSSCLPGLVCELTACRVLFCCGKKQILGLVWNIANQDMRQEAG